MCQLLGVNSADPMDATAYFSALALRGGLTDEHGDGFGAAFLDRRAWRIFLDHRACFSSSLAEWIKANPIPSSNVIAHIRKATRGAPALENTHPFSRELWGRQWVFAHNGTLSAFEPELNGRWAPVGDTDSERAFCWILQSLRERFESAPSETALLEALAPMAERLALLGRFNFLLGVGDCLIAHCSSDRLHWAQGPSSCVVATAPLGPEALWAPFAPGETLLFRQGALLGRLIGAAG